MLPIDGNRIVNVLGMGVEGGQCMVIEFYSYEPARRRGHGWLSENLWGAFNLARVQFRSSSVPFYPGVGGMEYLCEGASRLAA